MKQITITIDKLRKAVQEFNDDLKKDRLSHPREHIASVNISLDRHVDVKITPHGEEHFVDMVVAEALQELEDA